MFAGHAGKCLLDLWFFGLSRVTYRKATVMFSENVEIMFSNTNNAYELSYSSFLWSGMLFGFSQMNFFAKLRSGIIIIEQHPPLQLFQKLE